MRPEWTIQLSITLETEDGTGQQILQGWSRRAWRRLLTETWRTSGTKIREERGDNNNTNCGGPRTKVRQKQESY